MPLATLLATQPPSEPRSQQQRQAASRQAAAAGAPTSPAVHDLLPLGEGCWHHRRCVQLGVLRADGAAAHPPEEAPLGVCFGWKAGAVAGSQALSMCHNGSIPQAAWLLNPLGCCAHLQWIWLPPKRGRGREA